MGLRQLGPDHLEIVVHVLRNPDGPARRSARRPSGLGPLRAALPAIEIGVLVGCVALWVRQTDDAAVALGVGVVVILAGLMIERALRHGEPFAVRSEPEVHPVRVELRGGRILVDDVQVHQLEVHPSMLVVDGQILVLEPALEPARVETLREAIAGSERVRRERSGHSDAVPRALATLGPADAGPVGRGRGSGPA